MWYFLFIIWLPAHPPATKPSTEPEILKMNNNLIQQPSQHFLFSIFFYSVRAIVISLYQFFSSLKSLLFFLSIREIIFILFFRIILKKIFFHSRSSRSFLKVPQTLMEPESEPMSSIYSIGSCDLIWLSSSHPQNIRGKYLRKFCPLLCWVFDVCLHALGLVAPKYIS